MDTYNLNNSNFCIFSYNSRGFHESNQTVCQNLITLAGNKIPIICNQENFILKANKYKIKQCLSNFHIYFKPATKHGLNGRPKNGMFIAVPEYLKAAVVDVSPPSSRVQAIVMKTEQKNLLIINVYFPTDPKVEEFDTDELLSTIESINYVINKNEFTDAIVTGDVNCDFNRKTKFVNIVRNFIDEKGLVKSWDKFGLDFTHTTEINGNTYISTLDHFFWNSNLGTHITDAGVLHLPDNLSDHAPIYCVIQDRSDLVNTRKELLYPKSKVTWKSATDEEKMPSLRISILS